MNKYFKRKWNYHSVGRNVRTLDKKYVAFILVLCILSWGSFKVESTFLRLRINKIEYQTILESTLSLPFYPNFVCLSIGLSILFVCLSVSLLICLSIFLSAGLSLPVCLPSYTHIHIRARGHAHKMGWRPSGDCHLYEDASLS